MYQPIFPSSSSSDSDSSDEVNMMMLDMLTDDDQGYAILQQWASSLTLNDEQGSSSTRRVPVNRNRLEGHNRLYNDYFAEQPIYSLDTFRRRFRMRRHVFLRIVEALGNNSEYFTQRVDACRMPGLSPLQKCTAAIRMMAYGMAADAVDEYIRVGEQTARDCLQHFVQGINTVFGSHYLRRPNSEDIQRLLAVGESRGFPGMLGSIDCMHWDWKNCPVAWRGQFFRGDHQYPTIILEAVASYDTWIWHMFFGVAGTNNDINVLDRSPVFNDILEGRAPPVQFTVGTHTYNMGYYLTDGIYPEWATFVKSITLPQDPKSVNFAKRQESVRKDVERAFGVLQARFGIIKQPARLWSKKALGEIMKACIILHNMIVEDERDDYTIRYEPNYYHQLGETHLTPPTSQPSFVSIEGYIDNNRRLHD